MTDLLNLIASAAEHAARSGGDPADLFHTFTASLRAHAAPAAGTTDTGTYETVHDSNGYQLFLHTCGLNRWKSDITQCAVDTCVRCDKPAPVTTWSPAYRRITRAS